MERWEKSKREQNPRETANIFSLITFGYTIRLFRDVFKNSLQEKDIYEVPKDTSSQRWGEKMENKIAKKRTVLRLLWSKFALRYCILGAIHLIWTVLNSALQPYAMSHFISYFEPNQKKITRTDAYYFAGLVILMSIFHTFYLHNYFMFECKIGLQIRASLTSLLYRKILKINPTIMSSSMFGNIVTIVTKDINTLQHDLWALNDMFIDVVQIVTVCYLMYARMGNPAFVGIGCMFVGIPIQLYLSKLVTKMRLKIGEMSDERLQATQETLSFVRIIKMYTWEMFFINKIYTARKKEVATMVKVQYLIILNICIGILCSKLTFPILIMSYIWMGYKTNTELIFYLLGLFRHLKHAIGISIPLGLSTAASFYASMIRINRALALEELNNCLSNENKTGKTGIELQNVGVAVENQKILKEISLNINTAGLVVVTGPIGCGKSSLIKTLLKLYPSNEGKLFVDGTVSYASQDPWVFPSSIRQNILFGQTFEKYRYEQIIEICALSYDLGLFENNDETIVTDNGMNLSKGQQSRINLARAVYKSSDIYLLDDCLAALDAKVQDQIFTDCIKTFLKGKIVILVTQNPIHIQAADKVVVMDDGEIKSVTRPIEFFSKKEVEMLLESRQDNAKDETTNVAVKVKKENIYQEIKNEGNVGLGIYLKYLKFGGGYVIFVLLMLILIGGQFMESYSYKLISKWVDFQQKEVDLDVNGTNTTEYYEAVENRENTFNLYLAFIFLATIVALVKSYALLWFCRKASLNIHQAMVLSVVNSTIEFFDKYFIGNILNRFSYDLDNIDEKLPFIFREFFRVWFSIGGMIILITTVNWYLLLVAAVFVAVLVLLRTLYIPTGRALKRLEGITRSPVIGQLNCTLQGINTIRAFQAEKILKSEFDRHQDLYLSTYFMSITTIRAFGFFMDFMGTLLVIFIILILLFVTTDTTAGNVGLALSQVFMLTHHVQWAVRQWAELENQMTSVERALEYTEIRQEKKTGGAINNWPQNGLVEYQKVSLSYNSKSQILKDITFTVQPSQKIGIVGRTGAGKSSIISTLFRLYDFEGKIQIDEVDIKEISLNHLRRNVGIIPQDPVVFRGTIRDNVDPYRTYTDSDIWKVFEKVKMKHLVSDLNEDVGKINLSAGQKQLLNISRVILRGNKIIVLDEATANVDAETDAIIQETIKENFSDCTVFTIAHRLNLVKECDKILVLDRGEITHFESPQVLLNSEDNLFYKMVQHSKLDEKKDK